MFPRLPNSKTSRGLPSAPPPPAPRLSCDLPSWFMHHCVKTWEDIRPEDIPLVLHDSLTMHRGSEDDWAGSEEKWDVESIICERIREYLVSPIAAVVKKDGKGKEKNDMVQTEERSGDRCAEDDSTMTGDEDDNPSPRLKFDYDLAMLELPCQTHAPSFFSALVENLAFEIGADVVTLSYEDVEDLVDDIVVSEMEEARTSLPGTFISFNVRKNRFIDGTKCMPIIRPVPPSRPSPGAPTVKTVYISDTTTTSSSGLDMSSYSDDSGSDSSSGSGSSYLGGRYRKKSKKRSYRSRSRKSKKKTERKSLYADASTSVSSSDSTSDSDSDTDSLVDIDSPPLVKKMFHGAQVFLAEKAAPKTGKKHKKGHHRKRRKSKYASSTYDSEHDSGSDSDEDAGSRIHAEISGKKGRSKIVIPSKKKKKKKTKKKNKNKSKKSKMKSYRRKTGKHGKGKDTGYSDSTETSDSECDSETDATVDLLRIETRRGATHKNNKKKQAGSGLDVPEPSSVLDSPDIPFPLSGTKGCKKLTGKMKIRDQGAGDTSQGNAETPMSDAETTGDRHCPPTEDHTIKGGTRKTGSGKEPIHSADLDEKMDEGGGSSGETEMGTAADANEDVLPVPSLRAGGKSISNPDPEVARNGDQSSDVANSEEARRQSPRPPDDITPGTAENKVSDTPLLSRKHIRSRSTSQYLGSTDIPKEEKEVTFTPETSSEILIDPGKNKPSGPPPPRGPRPLSVTRNTLLPSYLYEAVLRAPERKRRDREPAVSTTIEDVTPIQPATQRDPQPEEDMKREESTESTDHTSSPNPDEQLPSAPVQTPATKLEEIPSITATGTPSPSVSEPDHPPSRLIILHVPELQELIRSNGGRGIIVDLRAAIASLQHRCPKLKQRILLLGTLSQHPGLHRTSGDLRASYPNLHTPPTPRPMPMGVAPPARAPAPVPYFVKQQQISQAPNTISTLNIPGGAGKLLSDTIPVMFIDSDFAADMIKDEFVRSRVAANTRALRRAIVYGPLEHTADFRDASSRNALCLTSLLPILKPRAVWEVGGKARELLESWHWLSKTSITILSKSMRRNPSARHFEETLTKHYWWAEALDKGINRGKKSSEQPPQRYPGMPSLFPPGDFGGLGEGQGAKRDQWKKFPENVQKIVRSMERHPGRYRGELELAELIVNPATIENTWSDIDIAPRVLEAVKQVVSLTFPSASSSPNTFDNMSPTSYGILSHSHIPGCLLYGPPGTGKTHLARVLASSSNIVMIHASGADIVSKWVGDTEKTIQALFSLARLVAPSIIFIDEADCLFRARGPDDRGWERARVSQFLAETDGLVRRGTGGGRGGDADGETRTGSDTRSTFLMLATNHPQSLDHAILRRVPLRLHIGLPSLASRERIFRIMLRDEELAGGGGQRQDGEQQPGSGQDGDGVQPANHQEQENTQTQRGVTSQPSTSQPPNPDPEPDITGTPIPLPTTVSLPLLASSTAGFSGSDIKTLCTQAAMICQHELNQAGRPDQKRVITMAHFHKALRRCAPTVSRADLQGIREFAREFDPGAEDGDDSSGDGADGRGDWNVGSRARSGNGSGAPVLVLEARISEREPEDGRLFW